MPFQIIRNDITKVQADAIVNTANPDVTIGDGVDSALYNAAGRDKLLAERRKIGFLQPGDVGITPAFNLNAKHIIHVSGPWWEGGSSGEEDILRGCYDKALDMAYKNGCRSIAFPLLATGTCGFPKKLGIQIAVDAFTTFLEEHEIDITLVVFGDDSVKISGELVDDVASYIDDGYVKNALSEEYGLDDYSRRLRGAKWAESKPLESAPRFLRMPDDEEACEDEPGEIADEEDLYEELPVCEAAMPALKAGSLDDVLKEIYTDSFEKHLQKLINKKGLKNSEVYATANISKQYFSKLLKGQVKPSKEKMLALAVGLRLNLDETIDFLRIAGYALSPISQTDAVVEYFIEHKDYNVLKIDIVLFDYGLDPLSNK